jgi:ATP-dependent Lhr-like helicase
VVGTLDARFVGGKSGGDFSLGGKVWQMVKCDEGHNLVVVVPGTEQTSRAFWTGGGQAVFSPLLCSAVQKIIARKKTILPLLPKEEGVLTERIHRLPAGIPGTGLCVRERTFGKRVEVAVYSFNGGTFNRLLTILLGRQLGGKAKIRYNDFIILVKNAGKEEAVQRVTDALRTIKSFDKAAIGQQLQDLPAGVWKFGSVLPPDLLQEMALSEQYRAEDFLETIRDIAILPVTDPADVPPADTDPDVIP